MKKYKVLERDVVIDGIYCDYVYDNEEHTYYLMTSYDEKYALMVLDDDANDSKIAFYFFSMEFCAMYDTWGKKEFIRHVNKYKTVKSIRRLNINEIHEIIDIINVY